MIHHVAPQDFVLEYHRSPHNYFAVNWERIIIPMTWTAVYCVYSNVSGKGRQPPLKMCSANNYSTLNSISNPFVATLLVLS